MEMKKGNEKFRRERRWKDGKAMKKKTLREIKGGEKSRKEGLRGKKVWT